MSDVLNADNNDFIVRILEAQVRDSQAIYNSVLDSATSRLQMRNAELSLIRQRINDLLNLPYMVNPDMIRAALNPTREEVELHIQESFEDFSEGLKQCD